MNVLDRDVCAAAWALVQPTVAAAARSGVTERLAGTVLVVPVPVRSQDVRTVDDVRRYTLFQGYVEGAAQDPDDAEYTAYALAKALTSVRTTLPSRQVQQESPHLLEPGMTKWGGSAVRVGLVAAFSGVQSIYDEMFAEMMLSAIVALCRDEVTRPGGLMDTGPDFL